MASHGASWLRVVPMLVCWPSCNSEVRMSAPNILVSRETVSEAVAVAKVWQGRDSDWDIVKISRALLHYHTRLEASKDARLGELLDGLTYAQRMLTQEHMSEFGTDKRMIAEWENERDVARQAIEDY